jgi:ABC-type antimicrobial peptide transport system permease subunit
MIASRALARTFEGLLFGVTASDPVTVIGVPLVLALVAGIAGYLPARRASRIDPAIALRAD